MNLLCLGFLGTGLGAAFTAIAAAYGIGRIGSASVESMARQPEAAAPIRTAMIITAALIEGVSLFGVLVCLLGTMSLGSALSVLAEKAAGG